MFPEKFIQRIRTQEYIYAEELREALQEPSPVSIRINPLKWDKKPLESEPVPWCATGFYLDNRPSFTLDPLFHSGCYYPQEASGMFIEQIFRQIVRTDGYLRVLDLCGAPGGKSTHLSYLIGSGGVLVANEVIKARASVLAENLAKCGSTNTIVTQNDPSAFSSLPGFFDVILVDAPCSGEGMFREGVAVNEWSEGNAFHCSERQKRILQDVWPALKANGILIYSTCTFNPEENERNVKWLTCKKMAEAIELNISDFKGIKEIDHQGIKGYGFYPGRIRGDGLFISVIRNTGKSSGMKTGIKKEQTGDLKRTDLEITKEWTTFPSENIIRSGEEIHSFAGRAEDYYLLNGCLKIIGKGTRICTVKGNDHIPAHELALSDGLKKKAFPVMELDYINAIAYLKRENIKVSEIPGGWFITAFDGIPLGFAKNLGNRINNYYPVNRRIRMNWPLPGSVEMIKW